MPWGDGTGPWWQGCRNYGISGRPAINPWCRGRGMRPGRGFWRRGALAYPQYGQFVEPTPSDEIGYLEDAASRLETELKDVRDRIERLRSGQ